MITLKLTDREVGYLIYMLEAEKMQLSGSDYHAELYERVEKLWNKLKKQRAEQEESASS